MSSAPLNATAHPTRNDRQEIYEVLVRYCRGLDRLDLELVRSAYHADGVDHHTGFSGNIDDWLAHLRILLGKYDGTQHLIGNHFAEIVGDEAVVETYGQATHWGTPADDPLCNYVSGFRYLDHMTRENGRWAIKERWAIRDWTRDATNSYIPKQGDGPAGRRNAEDPLHALRSRILQG